MLSCQLPWTRGILPVSIAPVMDGVVGLGTEKKGVPEFASPESALHDSRERGAEALRVSLT